MRMIDAQTQKIIIVEGTSDKRKVKSIVKEDVEILCTNGTIGLSRLDEMIDSVMGREVYILVDADAAGEKLRRQFIRELPEAEHIYIDKMYREVASTPDNHLATVLLAANIDVRLEFLDRG